MRFRFLIRTIVFIQISFFVFFTINAGFAQPTQSLEYWQQITDQNPNDALAWFNIGVLYEKGQGVQVNKTKAQQSYTKSINLGYAPAMFNLGSIYAQKKDYANARFWWEKAANESVPEAQYNLATLYEKGWGVKQNPEKAALWYQRAAETAMQKYLDLYQHSKEKLEEQSAVSKTSVSIFERFSLIPAAMAASNDDFQIADSHSQTINLVQLAQAESPQAQTGWPWVYSQPEDNFTIQLFATKEESKTAKFIQQYALTDRAKVIPAIVKGTQYYKVILGSFGEWNDAAVEIGGLPQDLRDERPWVRKFSSLYPELPEGTDTSASQIAASETDEASEQAVENEPEVENEQPEVSEMEEEQSEDEVTEQSQAVITEQVDSAQTSGVEQTESDQEPTTDDSNVDSTQAEEPEDQEKLVSLDKEQAEIKPRMPEKSAMDDDGPTDDVFTLYAKRQLNSNGISEDVKEQLRTGLESIKTEQYTQAYDNLLPLADAGLPEAQFRLALLYAEGKGVGLDLNRAFEFAKLSAEQGHPYGQRLLAEFYNNGIGVEANAALGTYWQQTGDDNIKKLEEL